MMNFRSKKGATTLLVLVSMLFITSFLMSTYIIISNKAQGQATRTEEIKTTYNNIDELNEIYNSYFASGIINIYTPEQLLKIGNGEELVINNKVYTFSQDATYVLMNDLTFDIDNYTDIVGENQDWIPIGDTDYKFEGNGHKIIVTKLDDTQKEYNKENSYGEN